MSIKWSSWLHPKAEEAAASREMETMTMTDTIYPYGPPVALAPTLFQVTGTLRVPVPRNMTIIRNDREELRDLQRDRHARGRNASIGSAG